MGTVPVTPGMGALQSSGPNASVLSEFTRVYEDLKQKLRSQPNISLQEPVLTATNYSEPIQPIKPIRLPNQRVVAKPKRKCNITEKRRYSTQ